MVPTGDINGPAASVQIVDNGRDHSSIHRDKASLHYLNVKSGCRKVAESAKSNLPVIDGVDQEWS